MTSSRRHYDAVDLLPYVESLQHQLTVAADAGGDEARTLAERLGAALDSATRLALLDALSDAADEISRELAPGSVDLRLRGRDPHFVVTPPPADEAEDRGVDMPGPGERAAAAPRPPTSDEDAGTARVTLRLPENLKARAERAASDEGVSVNAWLVRAVTSALDPGESPGRVARRLASSTHRYTGWVR
jgi:HicB family